MRIIAGRFGGRRLPASVAKSTRPTSDRVREAIFSVLSSRGAVQDAHVLDLFAGTGALGLEAISRGAATLLSVEREKRAAMATRQNHSSLQLGDAAKLLQADAMKLTPDQLLAASPAGKPFDLVLVDPPYADLSQALQLLQRLMVPPVLADDALIVVEHAKSDPAPAPQNLQEIRRYRYGDTGVVLLAAVG